MTTPRSAFWSGFWAGMAAPVSLFGREADYTAHIGGYSPAVSFSRVGALLSRGARDWAGDGRTGRSEPRA